jgi:hypothetical protein
LADFFRHSSFYLLHLTHRKRPAYSHQLLLITHVQGIELIASALYVYISLDCDQLEYFFSLMRLNYPNRSLFGWAKVVLSVVFTVGITHGPFKEQHWIHWFTSPTAGCIRNGGHCCVGSNQIRFNPELFAADKCSARISIRLLDERIFHQIGQT